MTRTLLLGLDIGSSSIKASLVDADSGELVVSASSPEQEMSISSPRVGWAEQDPTVWWQHVVTAVQRMTGKLTQVPSRVQAIGISYQMHGLVVLDKDRRVIHPAIIWCDSRAVEIGNKAFSELGPEYCLSSLLNTPGNFTASKLKWVKDNLPRVFERVFTIMLPGDYIALRLTGEANTTVSGLSEGILWDFKKKALAERLIGHYGFDRSLIPAIAPTFGDQGSLTPEAASELGLEPGIPVSYRAGDQPNNALSLNVLLPGEIAATAGTSGVIYGVTDADISDPGGRVNTFAHVNYTPSKPNKGVLLCINGTGIQYSWLRHHILEDRHSYDEMNALAAAVGIGSGGLFCHPFGNGAERSLGNKEIFASFSGINFNLHRKEHLIRAAQEGIAFSFRYGLDVMRESGMTFHVVRAGNTNLFQSPVFREAFVNTCQVNLELYNTDGSQGAARGAGLGSKYYSSPAEAFRGLKVILTHKPDAQILEKYQSTFKRWKKQLDDILLR